MKAFTQLALNAITSLHRSWSKSNPQGAVDALKRIQAASANAIREIEEDQRSRLEADAMANEGGLDPEYVERLR